MSLSAVRAVADAVLYEGYLLYPYRSTSAKNQVRWQFGVLGPPGAAEAGLGEPAGLRVQVPLRYRRVGGRDDDQAVTVHLRFLHVQARIVEQAAATGFVPVPRLDVGGTSWLAWDEAVVEELSYGPFPLAELDRVVSVEVAPAEEIEKVAGPSGDLAGRVIRRRERLHALLHLSTERAIDVDTGTEFARLTVAVQNMGEPAYDRVDATHRSFAGTHLLLEAEGAAFVSVIDPPDDARSIAAGCVQERCWPVLSGDPDALDGEGVDVVLAAPIILYDHPEIASQSAGDLFDATEIDEILTLRVMTMTEQEKVEARLTDPRAAAIIDRCDAMSPQDLQQLHGVLRDPHAGTSTLTGDDWWQAEAAAEVTPETDVVMVAGVAVSSGSLVRLRPSRRADAQDIFLAGRTARVSAVHTDLDGATHVAVTVIDDPAADLHDWYGRHLFFAPDELEPVPAFDGQERPEEDKS